MLFFGAKLLQKKIDIDDFTLHECGDSFALKPGKVSKKSGRSSYESFLTGIDLVRNKKAQALVTLPINKYAWSKAGIPYKGHTEALDAIFDTNAIMMLGCQKLFVALFTHHISIKEVPSKIKTKALYHFFLHFADAIKEESIGVLGLNPHAGDGGVIGKEDQKIKKAIQKANKALGNKRFVGPLVPDTAFSVQKYRYYVCMYHDQGLIVLKSKYFDESINVSLNLPIVRTSVDHGTAFDIAYKEKNPSIKSYINAIKEAIKLSA
jgi:4-hydroxythreonine-4-phosphate dehydrogenase